jgi:hypothetical protein
MTMPAASIIEILRYHNLTLYNISKQCSSHLCLASDTHFQGEESSSRILYVDSLPQEPLSRIREAMPSSFSKEVDTTTWRSIYTGSIEGHKWIGH